MNAPFCIRSQFYNTQEPEKVVEALCKIGYAGVFNYEIPGESRCPLPVKHAKVRCLRAGYEYLMREK